ncbi:hypothetical protein AQEC111735_12130 [Aquirufa ecclesiirivi]
MTCGLVKSAENLDKVLALTVTDKRSPPVDEMLPSVAAIVADSALYKIIVPVATPAVNVKLAAVPKFVPANVGTVLGFEELLAPEMVILFAPA